MAAPAVPAVPVSGSCRLAPKVLPGGGSAGTHVAPDTSLPFYDALSKTQAAQYGPQDLLACTTPGGGGRTIFIYDMHSVQLVQTLQAHEREVTSLLWKPPKLSYLQNGLFLVSGDCGGNLLLWDVAEAMVISRLQTPCARPVQVLSLLSDQHLLAITDNSNSYIFNAHLVDGTVLPPAPLPLRCREGPRPCLRFSLSKISSDHTSVVLMGDRARIISHLDPSKDCRPVARDLIYDSADGAVTVVDAFFSEASEEVLYFATPTFVGRYDWRLGMVLNEELLWVRDSVDFVRIFPSSASTFEERTPCTLPLLYSFTTDQRLTAWYTQRAGKFVTVSTDVRGARITAKSITGVVQSEIDPTRFAVLFNDGAIAKWEFSAHRRRWRLTHYSACSTQRATCFCRIGDSERLCCALESGYVTVVDATYSIALKRMNLVYSGGTKIILLCPHKHNDTVWVVSNRVVDGRHQHQVSLLDVRSGEVVRVLRKPSSATETAKAKEASLDPTCAYLLLSFWNGTFEVWNTETTRLIHVHAGLGVANVSWAPSVMGRCLTGVQGSPQMLSVFFSEGTMSLWSVYKDRCIVSRDAVTLLAPGCINGGTVQSIAVGAYLVVFDSTGAGTVIGAKETRLSTRRLQDVPPSLGPVRDLAGNSAALPARSSFASFDVFTSGDVTGGDCGSLVEASTPTATPLSASPACVAVVFDAFAFGVWDLTTGERLGFSAQSSALRHVCAVSTQWLGDSLAVLSREDGTIYIVDRRLTYVNSAVSARALRRPLQNPAFLLPSQRTFLQTSLDLLLDVPPRPQGDPVLTENSRPDEPTGSGSAVSPTGGAEGKPAFHSLASAPSSPLVGDLAAEWRPCRSPFGQLVTEDVVTAQDEMSLYLQTMLPHRLRQRWQRAREEGDFAQAALVSARWFGQRERQRLWALVAATVDAVSTPRPSIIEQRVEEFERSPRDAPVEVGGGCEDGVPYSLADPFTLSTSSPSLVRANQLALAELRCEALQRLSNANAGNSAPDDAKSRRQVARDFLKLGERTKAVHALLEGNYESPSYAELATLAVAVAGSTAFAGHGANDGARGEASGWVPSVHERACDNAMESPDTERNPGRSVSAPLATRRAQPLGGPAGSAELFTLAAKRATAALLAAGDVDAAVETLVLAGDCQEACSTLQSHGRWHEAAALARTAPLPASARYAVLNRWAVSLTKKATPPLGSFPAARLFLAHNSWKGALTVLAESAHMMDAAGILAVLLVSRIRALGASAQILDGAANSTADPSAQTLTSLILSVLADYSSVLHSIGSEAGERFILDQVAALKRIAQEQEV